MNQSLWPLNLFLNVKKPNTCNGTTIMKYLPGITFSCGFFINSLIFFIGLICVVLISVVQKFVKLLFW